MRWKMFFYNNDDHTEKFDKKTSIFKSSKSAPKCNELIEFEKDLFNLISEIKFSKYVPKFQKKLNKDLKNLLKKDKIIIFADKSRNIYSTSAKFYHKLMNDGLAASYKISNDNIIDSINLEAQEIISSKCYNLKNRKVPKFSKIDAFLTVKDHKKNFPLKVECRTINTGKNALGKISKNILENIVLQIRQKSPLIQWRNSYEAIHWFNQIDNKRGKCFVNFDIQKFYLIIKIGHLNSAISFAQKFTKISEDDIKVIKHTCNSVLTYNGKQWVKKDQESTFDVPMGSYFGAELCNLIGLYILDKLSNK